VDVRVLAWTPDRDREALGVVVELDPARDAVGEIGRRERLDFRLARESPGREVGVAIDVAPVDQPAGVPIEREPIDVPVRVVDDRFDFRTTEIESCERERVAVAVGQTVECVAVRSPLDTQEARVVLVGRDMLERVRVEIEHGEVLIEARMRLAHDEAIVRGRKAGDGEPAIALVNQFGVVTGRVARLGVDIEDGFVAPVGGEREPFAVVAPAAPSVLRRGAVGERRHRVVGIESVELDALVAALVHPEDQFVACRRKRPKGDTLVGERALVGPPARFGERPDLRGAGGVEQDGEIARGRERSCRCTADVEVALDIGEHGQCSRSTHKPFRLGEIRPTGVVGRWVRQDYFQQSCLRTPRQGR